MNDVEEKIKKLVEALSKQENDRHVKVLNITWKIKWCAGLLTAIYKQAVRLGK
jgi:hypothetical protein